MAAGAEAALDQETVWRLFTRALVPEQAAARAGDPHLAAAVLQTVSIFA
jgi:hypothetical protein